MKTVYTIKETREQIKAWKKQNFTIGFVPTMGFLHEGHKSLIEKAAKENDKVIVSIFVNPIQFGPNEDFETYPKDLKKDEALCIEAGAALIFAPEATEMYPSVPSTYIDMEGLTEGLCGAKRPGHFRGVCTVVSKLFNIVTPDNAYFGQKDAQQLAIIKQMVKDLNFDIEIISCPIVREEDGLAKSSRNTYLNKEERAAALTLSKSLKLTKETFLSGERKVSYLKELLCNEVNKEPLAVMDYVEFVDASSLQPISTIEDKTLVAIAIFIGKTRLIDNLTLEV